MNATKRAFVTRVKDFFSKTETVTRRDHTIGYLILTAALLVVFVLVQLQVNTTNADARTRAHLDVVARDYASKLRDYDAQIARITDCQARNESRAKIKAEFLALYNVVDFVAKDDKITATAVVPGQAALRDSISADLQPVVCPEAPTPPPYPAELGDKAYVIQGDTSTPSTLVVPPPSVTDPAHSFSGATVTIATSHSTVTVSWFDVLLIILIVLGIIALIQYIWNHRRIK